MADLARHRFCGVCGGENTFILRDGHQRPVCTRCDHVTYIDPKVAAIAFVVHDERVLLVKRAMNPGKGFWGLAGGFVEADEDPKTTAMREVLEETGLKVQIDHPLDIFYNQQHGGPIVIAYAARLIGGEMLAGDDAEEVGWFTRQQIPPLVFESTITLVQRWIDQQTSTPEARR